MSEARGIAVIGGGGHAKVVVSTLLAAGELVTAIFDQNSSKWGDAILGVPVVGGFDRLTRSGSRRAVLAIGDNARRRELALELALDWVTAVHPAAWVHDAVALGPGTVVFAGALIQPDVVVGRHAILNTGASVDHDCRVGDFVHVAPGCRLAGGVTVGEGALIGIGSVVMPGIHLGAWSIVAAGAAVVGDVAAGATVRGVPARSSGSGS